MEERRKNGEMVEEEEITPPSILFCIRHWERRYGFGSTFEFGRRVELESLEKPQLQLHLRLLLYHTKNNRKQSVTMITRPLP